MCYPPRKIGYVMINQLIKMDDSSIDYSGENENIIGFNL